jgi:hypothetical protein
MYLDIVKQLPRPTLLQTNNFIEMVCMDHSWYKHLSADIPSLFVFYIDPNAGRKLEVSLKKHLFRKDEENYQFSPYYDYKVDDYNSQFGYWNYFTTNYTINYIPEDDGGIRDSRPIIEMNYFNKNRVFEPIPEEIVKLGEVGVTAFLHSCFKITDFDYKFNTSKVNDQLGLLNNKKHEELISSIHKKLENIMAFLYPTSN